MMLAANKIENKPKDVLESLKIVEDNGQSVKKPRKLSKYEERLAECQQELQAVADTESKVLDGIGNFEKAETVDNLENETESMGSESIESETESVEMESTTGSVESMVESPSKMNKRILAIENQVENILKRLAEKDVEGMGTDSSQNKFLEMSSKILKLEKENKALHDENVSLRLENLDINMTNIVYEKDEKKKMVV